MKALMLLRHAKAEWHDPSMADFDRHLSEAGRAAAERMGRAIGARGLAFDAALVSSAARAVETAADFGTGYGAQLPARLEPLVYLASVETLLGLVRRTDDGVARLLIVGHNPGLERLALLLSRQDAPLRSRVEGFPTSAFVHLELDVDHWSDAGPAGGRIETFLSPSDLDGANTI
jgi:phosphohistidine phosphatase